MTGWTSSDTAHLRRVNWHFWINVHVVTDDFPVQVKSTKKFYLKYKGKMIWLLMKSSLRIKQKSMHLVWHLQSVGGALVVIEIIALIITTLVMITHSNKTIKVKDNYNSVYHYDRTIRTCYIPHKSCLHE